MSQFDDYKSLQNLHQEHVQ